MAPITPPVKPWYRGRWLLTGIAGGALYGVALRYLIGEQSGFHWALGWVQGAVMTVAFLALVPFVMGLIAVSEASADRPVSFGGTLLLPWLPTSLAFGLAILFRWEGVICVVFALPVALVFASLGGVLAGMLARRRRPLSRSTLSCVAFLPLLLAPIEAHFGAPRSLHTVHSEVRIHATAATVWKNIARVRAIAPSELRTTWTQRIGFPRPVEATLSFEGVGGVRHATFERGLTFIETVTTWEPQQRLAFTIQAKSGDIPPTTLDEHVTIGRYFDVLDGEYRLESLGADDIRLHLESHQRLSTDFNGYAGLWTDAVMQTLQTSILEVIAHRCEAPSLLD